MVYDIYIEINGEDIKYPFSFGTLPSKYTDGFYKTVIKWAKCFLTIPGTDLADRSYGTALATLLGQGVANSTILRDAVFMSIAQTTDKIKSYQSQALNLPQKELLSSARMLEFGQDGDDGVLLKVELQNAANELMLMTLSLDITVRIN